MEDSTHNEGQSAQSFVQHSTKACQNQYYTGRVCSINIYIINILTNQQVVIFYFELVKFVLNVILFVNLSPQFKRKKIKF